MGAILIEFAFVVPVLFSLIYYVQDLVRHMQIQERMQFAAQFAAQKIASNVQNIARIEGNVLDCSDLANTTRLANLSIFPGRT